jgi:thiopeptide-type bacteriocin biosynthesis protein
MSKGQNKSWLAAHLYYNEPWEEFLTKAVEPYVASVMRAGVVDQYFFIRYWDRGPHIRLRFNGDTDIIEQLFRPNLLEHFENYFQDKPSKRTNPSYPNNFPEEFKWLPNNSVQFFNYEPEFGRYGGPIGVQIAEAHFQISSEVALNCIKEKSFKWTYDDALGAAIKLHLSFAFTMGLDLKSAVSFFRMIFYNWLPRSFRFYTKGLSKKDYHKLSHETIDSFSKAFEMQKGALLPFHQFLWEGLEAGNEFEDENLNDWITKNRVIKDKLETASENNRLTSRETTFQLPSEATPIISPEQELLWNIFADYLHLTNNRLGISNKDEGYLGFLIMKSLKALQSNHNNSSKEDDFAARNFEQKILDELF